MESRQHDDGYIATGQAKPISSQQFIIFYPIRKNIQFWLFRLYFGKVMSDAVDVHRILTHFKCKNYSPSYYLLQNLLRTNISEKTWFLTMLNTHSIQSCNRDRMLVVDQIPIPQFIVVAGRIFHVLEKIL